MAFGRHQDETILVQLGTLKWFSDIAGRHVVRISNAVASRQDLANRLKAAGCSVDLSGTDWHSTGDFDGAVRSLAQLHSVPLAASARRRIHSLSQAAKELLLEASRDENGVVMRFRTASGFHVKTNGRDFVADRDPRAEALWREALSELLGQGMLEDRSGKGDVFGVTNSGYMEADDLREVAPNPTDRVDG
jgi:hypothetical protein